MRAQFKSCAFIKNTTMIKRILFFLAVLLLNNFHSQNTAVNPDISFLSVLKSQLAAGVSGEKSETDYPTYKFALKDLQATESVIAKELDDNGYKKPSAEEFINKINMIFKRIIDPKSESKYLYVNFEDKCSRDFKLYKNSNSLDINPYSTYIFKNNLFISDLYSIPEIMDYTKNPELFQFEKDAQNNNHAAEVKIYYWKDFTDLKEIRERNIKTILARNLYLFNDNKTCYKWLTLNDSYFMEALVKTFGYTQDMDLLKWVIERAKFDKKDPSDYGKLFWVKQCDETVKIHANTFKILQEIYTPDITNDMSNENRFLLDYIKGYLEYFADFNNKETGVSKVDKVKILANIVYFAEQYKYDKRFVSGYGDNSKMMGRLRFFLDQEEVDILQKNNYFNLPKFKEWWDNADYDEYFVEECEYNGTCGPDNQPMNVIEWRKQHPKK